MDEVVEPTEAQLRAEHGGWMDGNPFYLLIVLDDGRFAEIDLGERGWATKHDAFMRAPGKWHLVRKTGQLVVAMIRVWKDEQPYYVARHVGIAGGASQTETVAYGIGKKRADGHVDRFWLLANGVATVGDDLEPIALELLRHGQLG